MFQRNHFTEEDLFFLLVKETWEDHGKTIQELLQERLKLSIQYTFITVLEEEVKAFLNAALYQRTPSRQGHRNGHYERDLLTTMGLIEDLPVPRTRNGFCTELFERYQRRQAELDEAICKMFVRGISTAQVGQVVETLRGTNPSPSTVSRVFHSLDADFEGWKQRKLEAHYLYAFADCTYFTVFYIEMWWVVFLVLTIAGERLELGRMMRLSKNNQRIFSLAVILFVAGCLLMLIWLVS